jgi:hypothetical protein
VLRANRWSIVQGDFQEDELDRDHEASLDKEGVAVVCAEPVKDSAGSLLAPSSAGAVGRLSVLEYRGHEHDERNVE